MSPEPSIREFAVEYAPTIAQHANREVEQGYEIHLRIIRVQVRIGSAGQDSTTSMSPTPHPSTRSPCRRPTAILSSTAT